MCGIIGIVGKEPVSDRLVDGLKRMEYRGYDSAGVCTVDDGQLIRRRAEGKLANLVAVLKADDAPGNVGIAHTRWATHGAPTTNNAHPHATAELALVHNGIIENFKSLREQLSARGRTFESETDTEVVAHLVSEEIEAGKSPQDAVKAVLPQLRGAFALAIAFRSHPDLLIGARLGSPLVVGYGEGETYLGSDALALAPLTQKIAYLEEGDWVVVTREGAAIHDKDNNPVEREISTSGVSAATIEKGNYRHFMQKEIFEQPIVVAQTLRSYIRPLEQQVALPQMDFDLRDIKRITIVACGTSYYAGMVAKYWFETFARMPVDLDFASEFRYRDPVLEPGGLALFISQSGETADTLAALRHSKENGQKIAVVVNVPTSSMAREANLLLPTHAGPEIGVASTKAFTTQLVALLWFTTALAQVRGKDAARIASNVAALRKLPQIIEQALTLDGRITTLAERFANKHHALFLGRGTHYPIAMEGALKLKEISYIHAEAYAAGELKHGPLALVDEDMPVVSVAPSDALLEKLKSNLEEVSARGGQLITFACETVDQSEDSNHEMISLPWVDDCISPILYTIPLQLLSYHVALVKGTDVDKPRNLAKSVTVE